MNYKILIIICFALQAFGFMPFYFTYRKDCKVYGKANLAVPLEERFTAWLMCCPFWAMPLLIWAKG